MAHRRARLAWCFIFANLLISTLAEVTNKSFKNVSNNRIGCRMSGECRDGSIVNASTEHNLENCLEFCSRTKSCEYITFYRKHRLCLMFSRCPEVDQSKCGIGGNCQSSDVDCLNKSTPTCFFKGRCLGRLTGSQLSEDADDCLRLCGVNPNCRWFSFDGQRRHCQFTDAAECERGNATVHDDRHVSGRRDCDPRGW